MIDTERMGTFVASFPVPHEPRKTTFVAAGPLTFGIEPRVFDPVAEAAKLTPEEIAAAGPDSLFHSEQVDGGVCVHVFGTEGLAEYLRFDCFADEPHYHYIIPGRGNMLVHFDRVANGPMLEFEAGATVSMPLMNGLEAAALIRREMGIPTILMTMHTDDNYVMHAMSSGVAGSAPSPIAKYGPTVCDGVRLIPRTASPAGRCPTRRPAPTRPPPVPPAR